MEKCNKIPHDVIVPAWKLVILPSICQANMASLREVHIINVTHSFKQINYISKWQFLQYMIVKTSQLRLKTDVNIV